MSKRNCLRCNNALTGKITQKYCSKQCRDSAYAERARKNDPQRHAMHNRKWITTHKEKHAAWKRGWNKSHRESVNKTNRSGRRKRRLALIAKLGGMCVKCGFSDWRALQIDHVNGNGTRHRKSIDSYRYYKEIMASDSSRYQLLCANCNWIKKYENEEY